MQPKTILILFAALLAIGAFMFQVLTEEPDYNDPALKQLFEQLESEGYEVLSVESTLLGRYRLEAHSDSMEREIVIAPGAGTFLRDDTSPLIEGDNDGDD